MSPGSPVCPRSPDSSWDPSAAATTRNRAGSDRNSCRAPQDSGHADHIPTIRTYDYHFPPLRCHLVTGDNIESHVAFSMGVARGFSGTVPDVPVSGCPPPNMSKRAVNLNGSPDSRLRPSALHFVSMPPERFDWSDRRPPQASPSPAGLAPAGLAEAAPPQSGAAGASAPPDLEVRTRRSVHQLKPGTTYRIGRDPKSDIVMTDSRVSWRHAELRIDGDVWIIEDLDSTNGTFLESQRLNRIEISAACVVFLGNPDDGPVLRCVPQVPAAAAGQVGSPPADHPGTALSASPAPPAPPARRLRPPRKPRRASPPGRATASPRPSAPRRASAARPTARRGGRGGPAGRAGPAAERGPQAHGADEAAGQGLAHRPRARQ